MAEEPIVRNLPEAIAALQRQQSDVAYQQAKSQFPQYLQNALLEEQKRRVVKGQMPINVESGVKALQAANTGEAVTPVPDRKTFTSNPMSVFDVLGNVAGDVKDITKSIIHLPGALVNEVKDVADGFADDLAENRKQKMNPVQSFLSLPGVRFLPGSYDVAQLSRGKEGIKELGRHPLLAFLDVLPFAGKAAKGTKVAQAYKQLGGVAADESRFLKPKQPTTVALTRKLSPEGVKKFDAGLALAETDFVPTRVGKVTTALSETAPVMKLSEMFGSQAREVSRLEVIGDQTAARRAYDSSDVIGSQIKQHLEWGFDPKKAVADTGITIDRQAAIVKIATEEPSKIASLAPNEIKFIEGVRATNDFLADYAEKNNLGISRYKGEVYTDGQTRLFTRLEERLAKSRKEYFDMSHNPRGKREATMTLLANADPRWAEIKRLVDSGDLVGASRKASMLRNYKTAGITGVTDKSAEMAITRLRKVSKRTQMLEKTVARTNPARFRDVIFKKASENYLQDLNNRGAFTDVAAARRFVDEGRVEDVPGWDAKEFTRHRMGVAKTWQALQAAGEDPVFLQRLTKAEVDRIRYPHINERIPTIKQAKASMADISPAVKDFNLSISSQGLEILKREAAQEFTDTVIARFGYAENDVRAMLRDESLAAAKYDPRLDFNVERQDLSTKRFVPYDPEKHAPFSGTIGVNPTEKIYLPRPIAKVLEQMNSEGMMNLRAVSDPFTKAWRISLLPLSPRWHLYNVVGGMVMLSNETGPGALKYMKQGWEIAKKAKAGEPLPSTLANEVKGVLGAGAKMESEMAFRGGRTMKRLFDESQAGRMAKGLIQKSFDANQFFDDMYRSVAYLYGQDKALTKGMTASAAETAGVNLARKVLQDTAGLTPFERSILRQVFPFYAWNSHVVRYAMKYPFDHPIRASIIGGVSRQVLDDLGEGGTTNMLDMFSFGKKDAEGNQYGIRASSFNPFNDLGNLFTLQGWMGATSPVISTALQMGGVDTQSGGPELYPTLRYDTETGRLTAENKNVVSNLFFNTLPHAQLVSNLMGANAEFRRLMQTDPQAAQRMLISNAGLPVLTPSINPFEKSYNKGQKYIKAEIKRQEVNKKMIGEYLKKGKLDQLVELGIPVEQIQNLKEQVANGEYNPNVVRERLNQT